MADAIPHGLSRRQIKNLKKKAKKKVALEITRQPPIAAPFCVASTTSGVVLPKSTKKRPGPVAPTTRKRIKPAVESDSAFKKTDAWVRDLCLVFECFST
jgi:hypothetical protein